MIADQYRKGKTKKKRRESIRGKVESSREGGLANGG